MARMVSIDGQVYKRRRPLLIGLSLITIGINGLYSYYKVNDEARSYLRDESIKPGIALLAVILGWVLIVPPFISIDNTGQRVQRMEQRAGVSSDISPALNLILTIFFAIFGYAYAQEHLNRVWDAGSSVAMPPPPSLA
jgi:hypothetical protein